MSQSPQGPAVAVPASQPATPVVARIAKVGLSDYRAFPAGQTYEFNLGDEGHNLLLFGENGSGKTSLFRAIRDLTAMKSPPENFAESRHIFAPGEEGFISVQLTAGAPSEFRWDHGDAHPRGTGGKPYADLAERCRFLDHYALLETHFVHLHQPDAPNLFNLLVKEVLSDLPVIVDGKQERLGRVYERIAPPYGHWQKYLQPLDKACEDLTTALANHLPEVVKEGNRLIAKMGYEGMTFDLKPAAVKYDRVDREFTGQEISLSVTFFGKPIDHPQLFLNEARLTALALAIYLGAARLVLQSPAPGSDGAIITRLLVLDDVLIGLDLANRLPVLKVLNDEFADWQIILMTYDRVWYELAKENTEHTGRWVYLTVRELPGAPDQPGRPHVEPSTEMLFVAEHHFQAGDLMAAAVYIRAAFETRLKNVCEKHGVPVQYNSRNIPANSLWEGIVNRQKHRQAAGEINFLDPTLMNEVEMVRSTILNRLSHSGTPTLVKDEVRFALDTVKKLQQHQFTKV
jgi:energy-coupling factor transporter ATP-binding protein EcfA2